MLLLGHAGFTLGAAVLLNGVITKCLPLRTSRDGAAEYIKPGAEALPTRSQGASDRAAWLTSLGNRIDVRLLLMGSLLPDIIDKPVGQFFFRDTFANGRIFCHTLLFLLIITLAGLSLYLSRRKTWLLVLSFGTFTHLICDQMWLTPQTLLWPLYGWAFPRRDFIDWPERILRALLSDPVEYIPEIIGGMILIWFMAVLVHRKKVCAFIKNGHI